MSEFELGMMAGWAAGVITSGAVAGALDWWRGRNRVVTIHTTSQPCEPVAQDDAFGVDEFVEKRVPMIWCPTCKGEGVTPLYHHVGSRPRALATVTCDCCHGKGVIKAPPKKP